MSEAERERKRHREGRVLRPNIPGVTQCFGRSEYWSLRENTRRKRLCGVRDIRDVRGMRDVRDMRDAEPVCVIVCKHACL